MSLATTGPEASELGPSSDAARRPGALAVRPRRRFVRRLAIFALVNAFLVTLPLQLFPAARIDWPTPTYTLTYARQYLQFGTGEDSWWPMAEAARYLGTAEDDGRSVYDVVFFDRQVKFQYPLTSLLPMKAFGVPADTSGVTYLTVVSWLAVWVNAGLVVLVLFQALRRYVPHLVPTQRVDRAALAAVAGAMAMTFFPVSVAAGIGQVQVWINCLAAAVVWCWSSRRERAAGVAAGLICLLKPQLGLLLLWALLRRRYGFSAAFLATVGGFGLLSVAVYGWADNFAYLDVLAYMSRHGEAFFNNQSVNGLLNRLAGNGSNLVFDPRGFAPWNPAIYAATTLSSIALVGAALLWRRREHAAAGPVDLVIAILAFTMASPIAWDFHYGVLVPMYAVLLPALLRWPVWGRWSVPLLAASYVVASNYLDVFQHVGGVPLLTPLQSGLFLSASFVLVTAFRVRRAEAHEAAGARRSAPSGAVAGAR